MPAASIVQAKRIVIPRRNANELAERVQVAAKLIHQTSLDTIDLADIRAAVSRNLLLSATQALVDQSDLTAVYEPGMDRLIVAVTDDVRRFNIPTRPVSEASARKIFADAFQKLVASEVIKNEHFGASPIEVSKSFLGANRSGTRSVSLLSEYDFLVDSRFDGITFPHNRVSIVVRADGKIVRIDTGGPELRSVTAARRIPLVVTREMIRGAFSLQLPNLKLAMIDLAYIVSSDEIRSGRVIEPTYFVAARSGARVSAARTLEPRVLIEPEKYFVISPDDLSTPIVEYGQASR
jgi:hypothetical protein